MGITIVRRWMNGGMDRDGGFDVLRSWRDEGLEFQLRRCWLWLVWLMSVTPCVGGNSHNHRIDKMFSRRIASTHKAQNQSTKSSVSLKLHIYT